MITQTESELGASDYAEIQTETRDLAVQTILQRYGPVWNAHPDNSDSGRSGSNFDAIIVSTYLLRAYCDTVSQISAEYLASEVSGVSDASWINVDATAIISIDDDIPISLVAGSGLAARLFYVTTGNQIYYSDCANIVSGAFGAGAEVTTPSDTVIALAATSTTRLFYITENTTYYNRRFHVAVFSGGSWSVTDSDIYWPFPIYGFDALASGGREILLIATDLPPLLGARAVGTEVVTEVNAVQGIVTFEYSNSRWSDWQPFDVIDRVPGRYNPARDDVRLSSYGGYFFAVYERAGGDGDYEYTEVAVSRSKDGRNWEFSEFLYDIPVAPCVILPRGDYLYAVGVNEVLRSYCCTWAGQSPVTLDISDRVVQIQTDAADIRSSSIAMADPPASESLIIYGDLDGTLAIADERLEAMYKIGYHIDGADTLVKVSTEDVIARERSRNYARMGTRLATKDYLGRLNRVKADGAFEWPSQEAGHDQYDDPTGTGYGGMRHTAPYLGSWKAAGGVCEIVSKNKSALAITTFVTDALNGSASTGFKFGTAGQTEHAGIAFHVYDKDNYFFCDYYLDGDEIKIYKVQAGTATAVATSGNMTWGAIDTWYYMKIIVKYGLIYVYTSTDGQTWTAVTTGEFGADGSVQLTGNIDSTDENLNMWSGKFGLHGYAYSSVDAYPDWTPVPIPVPIPEPVILPTPYIAFVIDSDNDKLYRTQYFNTTSPRGPYWKDITGTLANINRIQVDQINRYIYVQCDGGLYRGSADSFTPTWTCVVNFAAVPAGTAYVWEKGMAINADGYVGLMARSSTCGLGVCTANKERPAMIVCSPDGGVTVCNSDLACTACCPTHGTSTSWTYGAVGDAFGPWSMCGNGQTLYMPMQCKRSGGLYIHLGEWHPGMSAYTMHNQGCDGDNFGHVDALVDMGGTVFVKDPTDNRVLVFTPGTADWGTDITPTSFDESSFEGFDRDATVAKAFMTDQERLYSSTGSTFAEVTNRTALSTGHFKHCSCYKNNENQLFLATRDVATPDNGYVLWTLDGGLTWSDRSGNLGHKHGFYEIRVVWMKPPRE